jgi:hypothetical protein
MRYYSINNYLNFNLSYKLTIDHILVDYNDKQIKKTNQHKLNKDLIIKDETWYNKCCYSVVHTYRKLTQLKRVKSELKRRSYEFLKILCVLYKIK